MLNVPTSVVTPKTKVGSALTWIVDGEPEAQFSNAKEWLKVVPRVYVMSQHKVPNAFGLFGFTSAKSSLRALLSFYMIQVPGGEMVVIAPNSKRLTDKISTLPAYIDKNRMDKAWAAFVRHPDEVTPQLFAMSAGVIPHVLHDLSDGVSLVGGEWASYLHEKLAKIMMRPRYFDASGFGILAPDEPVTAQATKPVAEAPVVNAYEIAPPANQEASKFKKLLKKVGL